MPVIDQSVTIVRPAAEVLDFPVGVENLPQCQQDLGPTPTSAA